MGGTSGDEITSVSTTSDGGLIVGENFNSTSINLGEGVNEEKVVVEANKVMNYKDGLIIKYNELGQVEWAKVVGGTNEDILQSVAPTSDGGYIAGGYFRSSSINLEDGEVVINNNGKNDYDGLTIKYNANGKVEWAKVIGGVEQDKIYSVASTSDGGIIAGGSFFSSSIDLGEGEDGEEVVVKNKLGYDGIIIKYTIDRKSIMGKGSRRNNL